MKILYPCLLTCVLLPLVATLTGCVTDYTELTTEVSDDTQYLQNLLNSAEQHIVIPAKASPWVTGPLSISTQDKTITFAQGCEISALDSAFISSSATLITIKDSINIKIVGQGAVLRMNKDLYKHDPWEKGEWRHGIAVYTSSDISIEGLTIMGTGGDGVYIGQSKGTPVCSSIRLSGLFLRDNYRQGVSVIAVNGFIMDTCIVTGTKGTPPAAGIDFEPNSNVFGLVDCEIRNCIFENNSGPGILMYLKKMTPEQPPVSLLVENSISRRNLSSLAVYSIPDGVKGTVTVKNTQLKGIRWVWVPKGFNVLISRP